MSAWNGEVARRAGLGTPSKGLVTMPLELEDLETQIRAAFAQCADEVPSVIAASLTTTPLLQSRPRPRRRSGLLVAAVVVIVATGAFVLLRTDSPTVEPSQTGPVSTAPAPTSS